MTDASRNADKEEQSEPTLAEVIAWTIQTWQAIEAHGWAVLANINLPHNGGSSGTP
jgi:hypothetical protein